MGEAKLNTPMYDRHREVVLVDIVVDGRPILSAVSREAITDVFRVNGDEVSLVAAVRENWFRVESVLIAVYREMRERGDESQPLAVNSDFAKYR
ncbi:protein of unknown function [Pararobbsia alpina]|uniref:hypothetical protein n=1 Tax=Pararobbsia alpina TaxID=621374 RepID=UPI0039A55FDC